MNSLTLSGLVVLALVATGNYFYGTKKNKWLVSTATKEIESTLKPLTSNYVNIGGTIGYNFTYALPPPFTNAKGTITLSPRHSLLYLPFSRLIGIRDRMFVNMFTKRKILGEAHLVAASHLKKARIEGIENMDKREKVVDGMRFILLWRGADLSSELERVCESLPDLKRMRHFCAYPETKTFFVYQQPKDGHVAGNLEAVSRLIPAFLAKEKA